MMRRAFLMFIETTTTMATKAMKKKKNYKAGLYQSEVTVFLAIILHWIHLMSLVYFDVATATVAVAVLKSAEDINFIKI